MKNSKEFKKECVRKDFNGLSEMLLGKNSAEQILGEDGIKLSNVAKAKVLAKRSQIIAEVLQQKTITIPSQDSAEIILNDVVTLFYAEAFSKGAKDGNVKKCAVGKHPKSEKLGSTGQAACCARIHSRYFTGGSPSGLRV